MAVAKKAVGGFLFGGLGGSVPNPYIETKYSEGHLLGYCQINKAEISNRLEEHELVFNPDICPWICCVLRHDSASLWL